MSCSASTTIAKLNSQSPAQPQLSQPSNQSPICRSTDCDCCRDRHPSARRSCCTASSCRCHRSRSSGDERKMKSLIKYNVLWTSPNLWDPWLRLNQSQQKMNWKCIWRAEKHFDNWSCFWEDAENCNGSLRGNFTIHEKSVSGRNLKSIIACVELPELFTFSIDFSIVCCFKLVMRINSQHVKSDLSETLSVGREHLEIVYLDFNEFNKISTVCFFSKHFKAIAFLSNRLPY